MRLSPPQVEAIEAAWYRHAEGPSRRDPTAFGCLVAFLGMALLTLIPPLGAFVTIPREVADGLLLAGVGFLVVGALVPLVAGYLRSPAPEIRICEEAADELAGIEDPGAADAGAIDAAVRLIRNAPGAVGAGGREAGGLRDRLGRALPLVLAVEARLVERERIGRVFTRDGPAS